MGTSICIQWSHTIWIKIVLNAAVSVPAKTVNILYVSFGEDVVIYLGYKTGSWKCFCACMHIKFRFSKYDHIFFQEVGQSILQLSLLVKCVQFDGIGAPATMQVGFTKRCDIILCCESTCIHLLFLKISQKIKIGLCIDRITST